MQKVENVYSLRKNGTIKEPEIGRLKVKHHMPDKDKIINLKYLSIDEAIDYSMQGFKVNSSRLRMGVAKGIPGKSCKGTIEFWFRGSIERTRIINGGGRPERNRFIEECLKSAKNLEGEKWFDWKPV